MIISNEVIRARKRIIEVQKFLEQLPSNINKDSYYKSSDMIAYSMFLKNYLQYIERQVTGKTVKLLPTDKQLKRRHEIAKKYRQSQKGKQTKRLYDQKYREAHRLKQTL